MDDMILLANPPFDKGGRSGRWGGTTPKSKNVFFLYPPWYLAYSTSLMRNNGIDAFLIDADAENMNDERFLNFVLKKNPELLLIETSTMTINKDLELMKKIKDNVKCKIALDGPHVTALKEEILKENKFIDFVLFGEYELTALELAQKINGTYKNIDGLAYRDTNKVIINNSRPLIEPLDCLPFPARDFLPMEKYNEAFADVPNQQLISSRGCTFQCVYCLWPQTLFNHKIRFRNAKNVLDEIELLLKKYNLKEIYFDDDSFTLNSKHPLEICNEIKNRDLNFRWSCMGHAGLSEEVLKEMVDCGCVGMKFGVESACPEVLKKCKKNIDVEKIKKFVKIAKEYGLRTHATFMIGLPGDTRESIKKTLKLSLELGVDRFQISIATPYPGTEFYNWAKENGYLVINNFSRYDGNKEAVVSYPDLSKKEIDEFFKMALNLTSNFNLDMIGFFLKQKYKEGGFSSMSNFIVNESPAYAKRLLRKQIFKMKAR